MTCHELRLYFQSPVSMDAEFPGEAEHLARCTECARLVEERHELGAALRLVRESAPEPSAALETAVLANYRRWVATHPLLVRSRSRRLTVVCWTAAVAGVLILAAVLFHPARRLQTSNLNIELVQPQPMAQPSTSEKGAKGVPWKNTAASPKTRPHSSRQRPHAPQLATMKSPAFEDFRSLMYCDALSCGGAMQLIRVQLPSSAAAFDPAAGSPDGAIYADVLVGADGIARGIRVVQ